ncbi:hypothetical protein B0H19DRAFT_1253292 [Mycena capillaripes]|nr:hypothetical protein B0H19DRAFT_1253292 [Mycena capillaripes]
MQFITGPIQAHNIVSQSSKGRALPPDIVAIYPMTRAQEGLWIAYSIAPQHTLYNLTMKFIFNTGTESGSVYSLEALLRGIHLLTARHGILRSTFHDNRTLCPRPFVAEWDHSSALPTVQVTSKPNTVLGAARVQSFLRSAVDLSSEFAVRWLVVKADSETELYLVAHHIALDGTSMSELSAELFDFLSASPSSRTGPPASDSFYKAHMIETVYRASAAFNEAKEFWVRQSREIERIQWRDVPPAPDSKNYREIESWFNFSKTELATWSARYRTSWFRVADHAVTVAFSGRPDGMSRTVGHFANALPIQIPLTQVLCSQTPTFDALLRLISSSVSAAKKHDRFSFPDLSHSLNASGLPTAPSQVAITLSPELSRPECSLYPVEGPYDLFFCFLEAKDDVSLGVIYDPVLFSAETVTALKTEFRRLVDLSMGATTLDLTSFPPLMASIPRLLSNSHTSRFHAMFQYQASCNPMAAALFSSEQDKYITYRELNEKTNQIAHFLRRSGIQRHKIVLLHLARGFATMEWIIGVLKSGAAYAIADQSHPLERTRSVISISQPDLIVDDGKGRHVVELADDASIRVLNTRNAELDSLPCENLDDISELGDLAYIVFTSGSTGQPKGVEIEHSNLSHFVTSAHASGYFPVGPGSRVLQFATFAFDAAVLEWSLCLALGGTLCFAQFPYALVGTYLANVIDSNRITHMHLTPSVLGTLPTDHALSSLSHISVGGEMVPDSLIETWRLRVRLQNAYGPTECTVVMTHQPHPRGSQDKKLSAAIVGKAHPPMAFYVSNEAFDRVLPVDEVGEICIGGPQVGRGYRNRQDLTDSRFAIHPELQMRLYRTGDRGKILPDGSVFLLGRMDREVKIRGYRIDLEDLERSILDLMSEVASVSVQVDKSGTSVCAFIAPETVNGDELKRRLGARLPQYMVPQAVYCLPRLPLNTNDKTDHKIIQKTMDDLIANSKHDRPAVFPPSPPISTTSSSPSSSPAPPESSLLDTLSKIWIDLLDLDNVPQSNHNFFELGGNSILAQNLARRLGKLLPLRSADLSVVDIFTHPTLRELASLLNDKLPRPAQFNIGFPNVPSSLTSFTCASIDEIESEILQMWKSVLNAGCLATSINFFDAGGNSLTMSQLHRCMSERWPNVSVNLLDLFHHCTIQSQAKYIAASVEIGCLPGALAPAEVPSIVECPAVAHIDIAIVGIAGRFPGASTPHDFYQLLLDRKEAMSSFPDIPADSVIFPGGKYVATRGALLDIEHFDSAGWGIKEDEALDMDPQQRLFLTVAKEALEDADCLPSPTGSNNIGLYVGAATGTWHLNRDPEHGDEFHRAHHVALTPSISARTAYHLNLQGPNITLNTACSSGMVALSLAVDHLRSGKCKVAVVGGVSIAFPQAGYVTAEHQLFSYSGHCRPFDYRADGTVPGDAVCALVLRRLDDAIEAGSESYSMISGIAIGSDGSVGKAGPTVPSPRGQAETVKRAWEDAGPNLGADRLVYAELHGSATPIGDALELEGMNIARTELGVGSLGYVVGSNKGNIGNCEAASGLVSIIKMCKSIQHGYIPPIQSFEALNPMINTKLPIKIASEGIPISSDAVLSVSSTGLGGVNAHCVMSFPSAPCRRKLANVNVWRRALGTASRPRDRIPSQPPTKMGETWLATLMKHASDILDCDLEETTNLRDAGLDSRGQMMLIHRVHEALPRCHLPISAMLDPLCTPASLVSRISQRPMEPASETTLPFYLTVIQSGNSDDLYVFLAPGGGSCSSYLTLVGHLPSDATIVALDHPNFDIASPNTIQYSIPSLAELYTTDLHSFLGPTGRCCLIGASFGGLVAVAMVNRLTRLGANIRHLILLDSPWPGLSDLTDMLTIPSFIRHVFGATGRSTLCPTRDSDSSEAESTPLDPDYDTLAATLQASLLSAPQAEKVDIERTDWRLILRLYVENVKAVHQFTPEPLHGTIPALYVAAATNRGRDPALWGEQIPQLKIEEVSGEHASLYTGDGAPVVAALIEQRLSGGIN